MTKRPRRLTTPDLDHELVIGSLCTGYGGLDLGVLATFGRGRVAWVADPDPHVRTILAARAPDVPNLGDIATVDWDHVEEVDIITAGFPCQDISAAGKRAGIEKGTRSGLWTCVMAGVRVLRPALVVLENVAALRWRNGGLHRVLGDLAEAGYDALWRSVRASDIGAAHRRERVFVLAWLRQRDDTRAADSDSDQPQRRRGRRDLAGTSGTASREKDQRQRDGRAVVDSGTTASHAHSCRRPELHASDPHRRAIPVRRCPAAADSTSFRHGDGRTQSRAGIPATAVATGTPAGRRRGAPADAASHGRDEELPGTAGLQRRPDAALGSHPADRCTCDHRPPRRLVAARSDADESVPPPEAASPAVWWGVYEPAIRRWEAALGRPTPHPTQPGKHGHPVLAPAFVEHLMGLPAGWVTDLPLPRTAQLRALGNGVVPAQAAHAVALLLRDLVALEADRSPVSGQEVAAA